MVTSKGYKRGQCWVCASHRPLDGHHVTPRAYGGRKDGTIVHICESCHGILHKESEHYSKTGKFASLGVYFKTVDSHSRMKKLIHALLRAKASFNSGQNGSDANEQRRGTQVQWPSNEMLRLAHHVKKTRGFTSLPRLLVTLLNEEAQRLHRKGKL